MNVKGKKRRLHSLLKVKIWIAEAVRWLASQAIVLREDYPNIFISFRTSTPGLNQHLDSIIAVFLWCGGRLCGGGGSTAHPLLIVGMLKVRMKRRELHSYHSPPFWI